MVMKIGNKFVAWTKTGKGIHTAFRYRLQKDRPEESSRDEIMRRSNQMDRIGFSRGVDVEFC